MYLQKTFLSNFRVTLIIIFLFPISLFSQIKTDEDEIPYDMSNGDLHLVLVKEKTYTYQEYAIERQGPIQPGMTQYIEDKGVLERKYAGIGIGLDLRFALLYSFIHKNKSRLRIADDFGLGTFLSSNSYKMKNVLANQEISTKGSSKPAVDGGLTFYYGLQATYRVSNMLDVGVKFLPWFATGNSRFTIQGRSYGLHLRVKKFYIDFRKTQFRAKRYSHMESKGGKFISVKYFLPNNFTFHDNGYLFASLQSATYFAKDPYGNGNNFIPPGYENFKFEKSRFNLFNLGIGLMIH